MFVIDFEVSPNYCCQRSSIGDDGVLDAGLARNVKPHIDLKMKLHKKLKKERPARTEAE